VKGNEMPIHVFLTAVNSLLRTAIDQSVQSLGHELWKLITTSPDLKSESNDATIASKVLHRMQHGNPPRIALVGMTTAGKTSLVNTLFGQQLADVSITPDTTKSVFRVEFPSGLVIYDTPGVFGKGNLENITRLFLHLQQDSEFPLASHVPYRFDTMHQTVVELGPALLKKQAPIDLVLWVVDASRTPLRSDRIQMKAFALELEKAYSGRLVVVGTHLDTLKKSSEEDQKKMLEIWSAITRGQMIPVSSITGEGLPELVLGLFRALSDNVSLAKMQDALVAARKLDRRSFVIAEISNLLADMILLDGSHRDEIKVASIVIFAIICSHYSVDEQTWLKFNGDAFRLGEAAQHTGEYTTSQRRQPRGFWEWLTSLFGATFSYTVVQYRKIGVDGLKGFLPDIYRMIYQFEAPVTPPLSSDQVRQRIRPAEGELEPLIRLESRKELATKIGQLLESFF
jgi:GTP-binding protein EngB required for normal cell division